MIHDTQHGGKTIMILCAVQALSMLQLEGVARMQGLVNL